MHCKPNSMSQPVAEIVAISGIPDEVTGRRIHGNRFDSRTYFILRCKLSFTDRFVYLHQFRIRGAGNPRPGHIRAVAVEFGPRSMITISPLSILQSGRDPMRKSGVWTGGDNGRKRDRLASTFTDRLFNQPGHFLFGLAGGQSFPHRLQRLFSKPDRSLDFLYLCIVFYYPESLNQVFTSDNLSEVRTLDRASSTSLNLLTVRKCSSTPSLSGFSAKNRSGRSCLSPVE